MWNTNKVERYRTKRTRPQHFVGRANKFSEALSHTYVPVDTRLVHEREQNINENKVNKTNFYLKNWNIKTTCDNDDNKAY